MKRSSNVKKNNSKIKNIINILEKRELVYLLLILILSSFGMVFEFLSITSIPLFFSNLFEVDLDLNFLDRIIYLKPSSLDTTSFILIFIILLFFLKSSFLFFLKILEFIFYKRIRLRLSKSLINEYIKPDFNLEIKDTSATKIWKLQIISNLAAVVENFIVILRNAAYILVLIIFLIFFSNKQVILFFLFLALALSIYYFFISKKLKKTGALADLGKKDRMNIVQDIINGIKDINILKKFNFFLDKFKSSNIKYEKYTQKNLVLSSLPVFYLEFFGVIAIAFFYLYLASSNLKPIEIVSSIAVIAYGGIRIIGLLKTCLNSVNSVKKSSFVIDILFDEFLNTTKKKDNLNSIEYKNFQTGNSILHINNLEYSYKNNKKVFKNLNLNFDIDKIYCLKGESGSGKSTFLDLILGLKNFTDGKIIINCKEDEIGYVPQECYLLDNTIKNNIAFGIPEEKINMEKVNKAARDSQIYDFIDSLPNKFETKISPFGSNISVGQKQRIGIARTLYHNPKILLLDEPTSSLDYNTEEKFINILIKLKKNRLIIMTTHKANFTKNYDHILELEDNLINEMNS